MRPALRRIPEIDGLRGVALTLVVLFHLFGQGRVSGGVDVFLTVSGFLLVLSLGRAAAHGRAVGLWHRWGRVLTRLTLPAVPVMLFVLFLAHEVLPPWHLEQNLLEVAASLLHIENWMLIWSQLSYGAAGPLTSPVQHFWSLSVQMQVFLALPLVAWLTGAVFRRHRLRALHVAVTVLTVASFVYAVVRNQADAAEAYFDTFARFWELGLGGVAALVLLAGVRLPRRLSAVVGWIGLATIVSCGFVLDGAIAYPGPWALVPVLGAVAVMLSAVSPARGSVGVVLRTRALVGLDKLSFHLYLWHWPVLIGYLAAFGEGRSVLGPLDACAVLAVSAVLAGVSRVLLNLLVERVVLRMRTGWTAALPLALAAAIALPVAMSAPAATAAAESAAAQVADSECAGAAMLDPDLPLCEERPTYPAEGIVAQAVAAQDDAGQAEGYADCWNSGTRPFRSCTLGPESGYDKHLVAVGDSHNNVLLSAYEAIAEANNWRIDVTSRGTCYWTDAVRQQSAAEYRGACAEWNSRVDDLLASSGDIDAIIVRNAADAPLSLAAGEDLQQARVDGYVGAWTGRPDPTVPVIALQGVPSFPAETLDCIASGDTVAVDACTLTRDEVVQDGGLAEAVERTPGARLVDLTDLLCDAETCSLVLGGVLVAADGSHLTAPYVATLEPYLERELVAALEG